MIKQIQISDLELCYFVIRKGFATVAKEFNITKENCPSHTSFIDMDRLQHQWNNGFLMFGYYLDDKIIGYVSICKIDDSIYELNNLAIVPEHRHNSYGKELINFCKSKVKSLGGSKIKIGIIDESEKLKAWYVRNGFIQTEATKFSHLPFTVCFMESKL